MKLSIDSITTQLLRGYPGSELAIIQYGTQTSPSKIHHYDITVPFTTNPVTARTWSRAYGTMGTVNSSWVQDHLPGSMYEMRKDSIWYAGKSCDLQTNACNIRMFLFTDALSGSTGSGCCSHLTNVGTSAPLAMANFGEYNKHKTDFSSEWTVYHVNSGTTNRAAAAAIASKGGSYTGTRAANPGDPQGTGGPRKLWWSGSSFALSQVDVDTALANINAGTFNATFPNDTLCLGDTAHFNSNILFPTSVLRWDFGDGNIDSNILNPGHLYASAGIYQVTLIAWSADSTCKDTITKPVVIVPTLVANFWADTVCLRTQTTFTNTTAGFIGSVLWTFGDGDSSRFNPDTTHLYLTPGLHSVELKVRSSNMCADSITKDILVMDNPIANFTVPNICQFLTVNFTNTTTVVTQNMSTVKWDWNFGNGQTSTSKNPSTSYDTAGIYLVNLISETPFGCRDTVQDTIVIFPKPLASFQVDTACLTHVTTFTDNSSVIVGSIVSWTWNTPGNPTTQNTSHTYSSDGTYSVNHSVTTNFGCVDDTTIDVIVRPLPTPDFTFAPDRIDLFNTDVCFTNTSVNGVKFNWDFSFFGPTGKSITKSPCLVTFPNIVDDTYPVKLVAENIYGCTDSITKNVVVLDVFTVFVPNSFTPNEDGKNDYFVVKTNGIVDYELIIFNRWGDKVFYTTDKSKTWNGKKDGKYLKNDLYVYKITVKNKYNETKEYHGHVSIIR